MRLLARCSSIIRPLTDVDLPAPASARPSDDHVRVSARLRRQRPSLPSRPGCTAHHPPPFPLQSPHRRHHALLVVPGRRRRRVSFGCFDQGRDAAADARAPRLGAAGPSPCRPSSSSSTSSCRTAATSTRPGSARRRSASGASSSRASRPLRLHADPCTSRSIVAAVLANEFIFPARSRALFLGTMAEALDDLTKLYLAVRPLSSSPGRLSRADPFVHLPTDGARQPQPRQALLARPVDRRPSAGEDRGSSEALRNLLPAILGLTLLDLRAQANLDRSSGHLSTMRLEFSLVHKPLSLYRKVVDAARNLSDVFMESGSPDTPPLPPFRPERRLTLCFLRSYPRSLGHPRADPSARDGPQRPQGAQGARLFGHDRA